MTSRPVVLVALLFGFSGCASEQCVTDYTSDTTNLPVAIASGRQLVGVSWNERTAGGSAFHATMVSAAGTAGTTIDLPADLVEDGLAGTTSVLWHGNELGPCVRDATGANALLDRGGGSITKLAIAPDSTMHATTFDGASYQVFWLAGGELHHRAVSEAGELGAVHDLGPVTQSLCVYAASDRAGRVLVIVDQLQQSFGLLVDPVTGTTQPLWMELAGQHRSYDGVLWFAGAFQLQSTIAIDGGTANAIESIDPTTGATTEHAISSEASSLYAAEPNAYAWDGGDVLEVAPSFDVVFRHPASTSPIGTLGADYVHFAAVPLDETTLEPAHLAVARGSAGVGTDAWQRDLAIDSKVHTNTECIMTDPLE